MEKQYLTVSALTKYLKRKFDADPYLERVYLTGEISNFRARPNAHQYFSLKDDGSKISAVMFKGAFQKLRFTPKEGMKVLVVGRVSVYEGSGSYQIYVDHMEPDGVGALYQALAELREKLQKEGLFDLPKKLLPRYPKRIAVVTSPSGAVIRDILTTVKRRYPIAEIVVFPSLVQGDKAADNLTENIQKVDAAGTFDTLIVARGGGSIEDLWPFNEERVARAIAQVSIPVISSVGHETDVTIADLVADVRAATPTAAAELAVPVLTDELMNLREKRTRLEQAFSFILKRNRQQLDHGLDSYVFRQPERLYEGFALNLDMLVKELDKLMQQQVTENRHRYQVAAQRLVGVNPQSRVQQYSLQQKQAAALLYKSMERYLKGKQQQFGAAAQELDLLSPLKIMSRGYTYTTKEGQVVRKAAAVSSGEELRVHFTDGALRVNVLEVEKSEEK